MGEERERKGYWFELDPMREITVLALSLSRVFSCRSSFHSSGSSVANRERTDGQTLILPRRSEK